MRNSIIFLCCFFLAGCSGEKTDKALLELDKQRLDENINYDKIVFYKFAKIAVRSAAIQDTTLPEYQKFAKQSRSIVSTMNKIDTNSKESISVMEALRLYKEYRSVKSFVKMTDEDILPLLVDGFTTIFSGQKNNKSVKSKKEKIYFQNIEHAVLSMAVLTTRDLGQPFALYECSKTQPELLDDSEIKTLLEFVRGFLFFGNNLFYLSEDGLSRNIKWLDKNEAIPLPYTKAFFDWRNLSDEQTHTAFHGMNYLFRGLDRMRMERKVDEERSLEDFDSFVKDMNKLGLQSELVWIIDAYLNLKRENPEKAIPALEKLKASPLFSNSEREAIQKTIDYVKDREPDAALKNVYDKAFIAKLASKYMISVLAKIDWEKVMQEHNVPHTKEIFNGINKFKALSNSVSQYTQAPTIDNGKKEITKKGSELLDQAKSLW
ncbi:short-chain dehydrogenase [Pedobacter jejuensis]|uniref:Short-chain dehydrogenase n=1 Tax=Pedobacter jejuensis TaxID=1268550 RepID=A0A3N0BQJ3_9SPHI|nr:short-chain dehydrogenase [Pedobacter jejuensis]RNL51317.1 short-chain dehydrogenase [Pedobacter jejuensis]